MLLLVFLTGCEKIEKVKPQIYSDADFTLSYNEMQINGDISIQSENNIRLSVDSPDSLNGFTADFKNGKLTANYKGISVSYDKQDLPDNAFFKLIFYSLKKISKAEDIRFNKSDDEYIVSENTEFGEVIITLDEEHFIKSLKIPTQGFYLELTKVS